MLTVKRMRNILLKEYKEKEVKNINYHTNYFKITNVLHAQGLTLWRRI